MDKPFLAKFALFVTLFGLTTPIPAQRSDELNACQLVQQLDARRGIVAVRDRVFPSRNSLVIIRGDCEPVQSPFRVWPTIIQLSPISPSARSSVNELLERFQSAAEDHVALHAEATLVGSVEAIDPDANPQISGFGPEGKYPVRMGLYDVKDVSIRTEPAREDLQQVTVCEALKQPDRFQRKRIALRGISQSVGGSHALCTPCDQPIRVDGMSFPPCVIIDYSLWRTKMLVPGFEADFTNQERTTTGQRDRAAETTYIGAFDAFDPHAETIQDFGYLGVEFAAKLHYESHWDRNTALARRAEEWTTEPHRPLTRRRLPRPENCAQLKSFTELVSKGCSEQVKNAIRAGADVNAPDSDGQTPLQHAIQWSHADLVEVLLRAGAEVNYTHLGGTALCSSATSSRIHITRLLLDYGAEVNQRGEIKCNALVQAAGAGRPENVALLISAGANIESRDRQNPTPLQAAVFGNHPENVRMLLAAGADPDVHDENGKSPLMRYYRTPALAEALIEGGANVDDADYYKGVTVLMLASRDALPRLVRRFIAAGANVNQQDKHGNTALFYAVEGTCPSCISHLRSAGADVGIVNSEGKTVLDTVPQETEPAVRRALTNGN